MKKIFIYKCVTVIIFIYKILPLGAEYNSYYPACQDVCFFADVMAVYRCIYLNNCQKVE